MPLVVIDAGHGGSNPGAVYRERREKDDALALSLAVGELLKQSGVNVYYTRTEDIYESPAQKAMEGNAVGADFFFVSPSELQPIPQSVHGGGDFGLQPLR